jgi:transposase
MTHNRQQRRQSLLTILACGATVAQAAQQTGISERTVYRYLAKPAFRRELEARQDETAQRTAARLLAAAPQALKTLIEVQNSSASPGVRRAAARDVLELSQRHRETITLEKRLTALETQAAAETTQAGDAGSDAHDASTSTGAQTLKFPTPSAPPSRRRLRGTHALLHALAAGATIAKAAAHANVSECTVYRRLADADFCKRLEALQAEMVQRNADLLLTASLQACQTLVDLLAPTVPISVRRAAARDILDPSLSLRQNVEMEKRLAVVEARAWSPPQHLTA